MDSGDIKTNKEDEKIDNTSTSIEIKEQSDESKSVSINNIINSETSANIKINKENKENKKSEFESHIIEAYKIISGFYKNENDKNNNIENPINDIQLCEN